MNNSPLLTETEAADYLNLARATLARWRWRGDRGPAWAKLGGAVRYSRDNLDSFIAAGAVAP